MKKKIIAVMSIVLIGVVFCACGSQSGTSSDAADDNVETTAEIYTDNESAWCSSLFENSSTQYNNDLALVAAEMSEAAEDETGDGIKDCYSNYGIQDCETYNYGQSGAFAIGWDRLNINGTDTTILVITARGSTTFGEYLGDLFKGWYGDPDKVHIFLDRTVWDNVYDFFDEMWREIEPYVEKHPAIQEEGSELKILIAGHSLGGAAANMIGAQFTSGVGCDEWWGNKVTKKDIYVYTFGAIKVLTKDENVSEGYENIHNIYNYYDSYGPNGNLSYTNASSANAKFGHTDMFNFIDQKKTTILLSDCDDHLMQTYIEALTEHENGSNFIDLDCEGQTLSQSDENEEIIRTVDFSIEGTWKNTGSTTFGQAQSGSIIVFDGEHCNYYSPYDTYVFYQENGQWTLECTSYIFAETLSFRVDIIDEDTIDVYYGSDPVRLERISKNTETIEEPEEKSEQQSASGFAIEGSWKSVGSYGFGQAQPGATVTFDGTHCNFFSPYDTYAFYQENGQWVLDCTSFLFAETLSFKVEIIDADNINVYYGSNCTELKRMN